MAFHPIHSDPDAPDAKLAEEFGDYLGTRPALQVVIELLDGLRKLGLPWWTPEQRRAAHPSAQRMKDLDVRPDVRQRIMMALTHMPPRASRRLDAELQASLIDEVLLEDVTIETWENTFLCAETVAYGDPAGLLREVVAALPWDENTAAHRKVLEIFMDGCLRERSYRGKTLPSFLTWLEVRYAIDADAWQERLPRPVRVSVDRARLEQERSRPGAPFTARQELETVGLATVREHLPLRALAGIFAVALEKLDADTGGARPRAPAEPPARRAPKTADEAEDERAGAAPIEAEADEELEAVPAPEGWSEEDAQYLLVGAVSEDELLEGDGTLVPPSDNPWVGEDLTDPGIKADAAAKRTRAERRRSRG